MTDVSNGLADTRLLQAVHKTFRSATTRMVDASARMDPAALRKAIGPFWDFYSAILNYHHHTEDTEEFPALTRVYPEIKPLIEELGRDHVRMEDAIANVDAAMESFDKNPDAAGKTRLNAALVELRDLFFPHLDREDADVIPMFAKWIPPDEWAAMDEKALRNIPKAVLPIAVGALDETIRSLPYAEQPLPPPLPVRVMLSLSWRRKWSALVRPLLV